jgi:CheY-like chemotaxis protein/anti-sigma regulatory factor (Ser/Thr protein kinase)
VIGDADRVRQILVNLAGNAVKFTQVGGVGVEVARVDDGIALTVRDTGPGIPPERIPHLFEEFEQGDGSASRRHEGTGLGLAITRRLVARMGGRIETESTVGQGSCFTAILPLAAAVPAVSEPQAAPVAVPTLPNGHRVLIVAGSPFQAPFLARRLARVGADAVVVATEADGLDILAAQPFDAVIADRSLGDAAVRTLARMAKARGVRCSLILLSPFDRREFGSPGAAGFDGYLIKPVRARSLLDRLMAPTLPRAATAQPAVDAGSEPAPRSGARVLLAEDNPINALLATKALERLGATVVPARDGLEAVALFEAGTFDLALVDIRMPGLDGLETARRIRVLETARGGGRLHLVALTANAGRDDERAARAAGFDGFLPKPLNLRALPALLERRSAAA